MGFSSTFSAHALGITLGGTILAGATVALTSMGPDFTDVARDAQRFHDNEALFESAYMDADFIRSLTPEREVICPHGYAIDHEDSYSPLHLASWRKAREQFESPSLTLRFYHVGQCEKDVDGVLHTLPFNMHYHADFNAYTIDEVLETRFEEGERTGYIMIERDGYRMLLPALKTVTLNYEQAENFNPQELYVTLEDFRVDEHLHYETPRTIMPD